MGRLRRRGSRDRSTVGGLLCSLGERMGGCGRRSRGGVHKTIDKRIASEKKNPCME